MSHWVGIAVVGSDVTVVGASVPPDGPIIIEHDSTWSLQKGDKADGFKVMHQQILDHLTHVKADQVVIKASAIALGKTTLKHLESAELRGIVIGAAAAVTNVSILAKNTISRKFGKRKFDEYVKDDDFWSEEVAGAALRKGSREAAMLLLAFREQQ